MRQLCQKLKRNKTLCLSFKISDMKSAVHKTNQLQPANKIAPLCLAFFLNKYDENIKVNSTYWKKSKNRKTRKKVLTIIYIVNPVSVKKHLAVLFKCVCIVTFIINTYFPYVIAFSLFELILIKLYVFFCVKKVHRKVQKKTNYNALHLLIHIFQGNMLILTL